MEEYDLVVIGGGSGSQVATAAAEREREAAVIEPGPLGGACVTRGCVPSKALIHRADVVDAIRRAPQFGIDATVRDVEYAAITDAIHDAVYAKADRSERRLRDAPNVTLYRGEGRFVGERTVAVEGDESARVRGEAVVVAVGSRPSIPPIDGVEDVDYYTSDDVLFLDERPDDLVIVGGGYIGAELGYFFGALGAEVSIVGRSDRLVPHEDDDVSDLVTTSLERYCDVYVGHEATAVSHGDDGVAVAVESADGESTQLEGDALLVAAGRRPNIDTLDPEEAGVAVDGRGYVAVDEHLETTAEGVWALGDVLEAYPFKHAADYESRVVAANVLDDADETVDYEGVPHAVFTSPQVASVGKTEETLETEDVAYESTLVTYDAAPKGLILGEDDSFVKLLAEPGGGDVLGCHVAGSEAATMIHEVAVAMQSGPGTVDGVADAVHVHPALNEVVLKAFDDLSSLSYSTAPDWRKTTE